MENDKFKYLKPEQYYGDLYDRSTVEECRRIEKGLSKSEYKPKIKSDKKSKKKDIKVTVDLSPIPLYFVKGERYLKRAETIRKWMDRDRVLDEKLENAVPPQGISCLFCKSAMEVTIKQLHPFKIDEEERVLFFFECPSCGKRRAFFEEGDEWRPTPMKCSKCQGEIEATYKRKGQKIFTTYKCLTCSDKEVEALDLNKKEKPEKIDPNLEADRKRFCLTEEQGREYIQSKEKLEDLSKLLKESKEQAKIQKELTKIKKLPVAELQKLLGPVLEREGYIKLDFSKPEIVKGLTVQFTLQDSKASREEYHSRIQLQRVLKKKLKGTNWRLMSDGVLYRLGILTGRLRGYESEEDLIRLIKVK